MSQQIIHCKMHEFPDLVLELVKRGLTFEAHTDNDMVRIHLTGGF